MKERLKYKIKELIKAGQIAQQAGKTEAVKALAHFAGVTEQTLYRWMKLRADEPGSIPLDKAVQIAAYFGLSNPREIETDFINTDLKQLQQKRIKAQLEALEKLAIPESQKKPIRQFYLQKLQDPTPANKLFPVITIASKLKNFVKYVWVKK